MEDPITLNAESKDELNRIIDEKLKQGYLIKGPISKNTEGRYQQVMVLPNNIDAEFTLGTAIKIAIFLPIYVAIFYFFI